MAAIFAPRFDDPHLLATLNDLPTDGLDNLRFGVIGFDDAGLVQRYNRFESDSSGLSAATVLHTSLFLIVAPCMNNYLIAQRFEDAASDGTPLDDIIGYVLTHRMRPLKVRLRLLAAPTSPMRYVLVQRPV